MDDINIVIEIALKNTKAFHTLALAIPEFGRRTLSCDYRERFKVVTKKGTTLCRKLHSFDGQPARVTTGKRYWYEYGKKHRGVDATGLRLPAIEYENGNCVWYENGIKQRSDVVDGISLPAVVHANGYKCWYKGGIVHRDDVVDGLVLPAVEHADGNYSWFRDGHRHHIIVDKQLVPAKQMKARDRAREIWPVATRDLWPKVIVRNGASYPPRELV